MIPTSAQVLKCTLSHVIHLDSYIKALVLYRFSLDVSVMVYILHLLGINNVNSIHNSALKNNLIDNTNIWTMIKMFTCSLSASHKPNPSSVPQGNIDSCSTLPWVKWEVVTVVESIP